MRSEQEVRDAVAGLNHQIVEWRKIPTGPPIFVALVDAEAMVAKWREAQTPPASSTPTAAPAVAVQTNAARRRRWWRRLQAR